MTTASERALVLERLEGIEQALKTLLSALACKNAPGESITAAIEKLEALPFDAEATVRAFQGASAAETLLVNKRLTFLADLDAIARTECQKLLATTTVAIERAHVLKSRLDTLAGSNDTGDSVDCVR